MISASFRSTFVHPRWEFREQASVLPLVPMCSLSGLQIKYVLSAPVYGSSLTPAGSPSFGAIPAPEVLRKRLRAALKTAGKA